MTTETLNETTETLNETMRQELERVLVQEAVSAAMGLLRLHLNDPGVRESLTASFDRRFGGPVVEINLPESPAAPTATIRFSIGPVDDEKDERELLFLFVQVGPDGGTTGEMWDWAEMLRRQDAARAGGDAA